MRLLHTADWHLGRTLHRVPLLDAQREVLDHLVQVAREERVDAILLAGDVFDRALPPVEAVRVAGDALRRLAEIAPVIAISGNHDSAGRLGFAAELIAAGGVHLRTEPLGAGDPVVLDDEHGPVAIYALPYLDPDLTRGPLGVEERSHEAVIGAAMSRVRADLDARTPADGPPPRAVVVAHAFVQGGEPSESERDISIGGAQTVPPSVFAGVTYAALGHLHRPHAVGGGAGDVTAGEQVAAAPAAGDERTTDGTGREGDGATGGEDEGRDRADGRSAAAPTPADDLAELGGLFALALEDPAPAATATAPDAPAGPVASAPAAAPATAVASVPSAGADSGAPPEARPTVRYAGSPLPYSFTEADAAKTTAIVELDATGVADVRFVPVPAPFRLVRLRGTIDELLGDPAHAEHEHEAAWVEITLTDARLPSRPMERLRRRFPRVLVLQHAPEGELAAATIAAERVQGRSDLEVLERFVEDVRGAGPDDAETALLRAAAERVGRDHEED
nr:exonuclease SbcCD subunit D [Patulibacter americanus]